MPGKAVCIHPEIAVSDYVEGGHELLPVQLTRTHGRAEEFPLVAALGVPVDTARLREEFEACAALLNPDYLGERKNQLGRPFEDVVELLTGLGFTASHYTALGMQRPHTTELLPVLGAYTRELIASLGPACRAHYVLAQGGLQIKPHIDCRDYSLHGFRIHIPILNRGYFRFHSSGGDRDFILTPGTPWFVNNARLHSVCNPTAEPRLSILLQMMSDQKLLQLMESGPAAPQAF